jgi:hypothetical protein
MAEDLQPWYIFVAEKFLKAETLLLSRPRTGVQGMTSKIHFLLIIMKFRKISDEGSSIRETDFSLGVVVQAGLFLGLDHRYTLNVIFMLKFSPSAAQSQHASLNTHRLQHKIRPMNKRARKHSRTLSNLQLCSIEIVSASGQLIKIDVLYRYEN